MTPHATSQLGPPQSMNDTINVHTETPPHWSQTVVWRAGRFDPMSNAPTKGYPILHIRGRDENGKLLEPMHYAYGDGDGLMPPFRGWFIPNSFGSSGFEQCSPVEWQPLSADPEECPND